SAAINVSAIPAVAAESTSNKDIDPSHAGWATVHSQPANAADNEKTCRAYAASFYESVVLRQAAAGRVDGAGLGCTRFRHQRFQRAVRDEVRQLNLTMVRQCQCASSADDPLPAHNRLDVVSDPHSIPAPILGPSRRGHL